MTTTADIKEQRVRKYEALAGEAMRRLTDGGLGQVNVHGYGTDERPVRTALRRAARAGDVPVTIKGWGSVLRVIRTDLDYSDPSKVVSSDPRFVYKDLTSEEELRITFSYKGEPDPAMVAKRDRMRALRAIEVNDWA